MFATDTPVSEEALQRVRAAGRVSGSDSSDTAATTWSQMRLPDMATTLAGLRACQSAGPYASLPRVHMLSTLEDIRAAYPNPPASALRETPTGGASAASAIMTGGSSTSSSTGHARKRARTTVQAAATSMNAAAERNSSNNGAARAEGPVMSFETDYQRVDYMGRSFLEPPAALVQSAAPAGVTERPCQPPQAMRGIFKPPVVTGSPPPANTSGTAAAASLPAATGIQLVRWAPPRYGHLLFAANLKGEARLWEAQGSRRPIASFYAHTQPVKSLEVTTSGEVMSTGSIDGTAVLWDVEAGACKAVLTNPEKQQVGQHCHHPSDEDSLVLVAVDRRVVLYDIRASHSKAQREYTGHMGAILNLTLLSGGTKFLTTAEDRTLRTWDFRIPVQIKQFADANMHAITHVVHHPSEDFLAAQSLDNKVIVFSDEGAGKLKLTRQREFTGHTTSGTRCQLAFSHDGQYLSSGDIEGGLYLWRWSSGELVKTFKAHSQMLVSHQWHPLEPSRIVTGAWDGYIKNWF